MRLLRHKNLDEVFLREERWKVCPASAALGVASLETQWCTIVQQQQDAGGKWSDAVKYADSILKDFM